MEPSSIPKKEKKGLSRAWRKFKEAFKSSGSSTASASMPKTKTTTTSAKAAPTKASPLPESSTDQPQTTAEGQPPQTSDADRRLEKARAIFKKYDLDFDEEDWKQSESRPKEPRERVHKPIRMRVKYTCHECMTTFGRDKTCVQCQHKRCAECIRYPPKKDKAKAGKSSEPHAPTTSTTIPAVAETGQTVAGS